VSDAELELIRNCFEGATPAILATVDRQGMPNVSLISHVHYIGAGRVALSYQFFNKTRKNLLATGTASVEIVDPVTCARYRLTLIYEKTETAGPLFETMKARLAGIASHAGMESVFRLLGSDIFRVRAVEAVPGPVLPAPPAQRDLLGATRRIVADLCAASTDDLGALVDRALDALGRHLGIGHAMVLSLELSEGRLYTVASRGYPVSGVGSEVPLGAGVIGVAAQVGVPIRIGQFSADYAYGAAIRDETLRAGFAALESVIPFPGMSAPGSQIALPVRHAGRTLGVLFAESAEPMRFWHGDEDALALVADHLAVLMARAGEEDSPVAESNSAYVAPPTRPAVTVRLQDFDKSVFLDHEYLIKGVAGAIFWKLASEHVAHGRTEFTNRELRNCPELGLPRHAENLEARLVLLERRLSERREPIRLERLGRGRFRLVLGCPLRLETAGGGRPHPA
jgi:adenylate cyclase